MAYADFQTDIQDIIGDLNAEAGVAFSLTRRTGSNLSTYVPSTDLPGGSTTTTNFTATVIDWSEDNLPSDGVFKKMSIMADCTPLIAAGVFVGKKDYVTVISSSVRWEVVGTTDTQSPNIQIIHLQQT